MQPSPEMDVNVTAECWDIDGEARWVHVPGYMTEAPRFSDDKQDVRLGIKYQCSDHGIDSFGLLLGKPQIVDVWTTSHQHPWAW